MTSPLLAAYRADLLSDAIQPDDAQIVVLQQLEKLYQQLAQADEKKRLLDLIHLFQPNRPRYKPVKGLYLWGTVGRGKTYLLDLFFQTLEREDKARFHYHRFMQHVHERLRKYRKQPDPLKPLAHELAIQFRVLILDEFLVLDIADAMLLAGLMKALFFQGVCVLCTSNVEPEKLYEGGLQRIRFLPAIAAIQENMTILELGGALDYRQQWVQQQKTWLYPLNEESQYRMEQAFNTLLPGGYRSRFQLKLQNVSLACEKAGQGAAWFRFDALCQAALGSAEYLQICQQFGVVFISGVPCLTTEQDDAARRFITLIDIIYDLRVKLMISADCTLTDLYRGTRLKKEFKRTSSRLTEIQTEKWWSLAHRPFTIDSSSTR